MYSAAALATASCSSAVAAEAPATGSPVCVAPDRLRLPCRLRCPRSSRCRTCPCRRRMLVNSPLLLLVGIVLVAAAVVFAPAVVCCCPACASC